MLKDAEDAEDAEDTKDAEDAKDAHDDGETIVINVPGSPSTTSPSPARGPRRPSSSKAVAALGGRKFRRVLALADPKHRRSVVRRRPAHDSRGQPSRDGVNVPVSATPLGLPAPPTRTKTHDADKIDGDKVTLINARSRGFRRGFHRRDRSQEHAHRARRRFHPLRPQALLLLRRAAQERGQGHRRRRGRKRRPHRLRREARGARTNHGGRSRRRPRLFPPPPIKTRTTPTPTTAPSPSSRLTAWSRTSRRRTRR